MVKPTVHHHYPQFSRLNGWTQEIEQRNPLLTLEHVCTVAPFYHVLTELFPQIVQFNLSVLSDKLPKWIISFSGLFFFFCSTVKFEQVAPVKCHVSTAICEIEILVLFFVLVHFFVLLFGLPRWPSCRPRAARGCASPDVIKYLCTRHCWEENNLFLLQRSTGKCPFGLLLTLVLSLLSFLDAEYLFYLSGQGNAYITCMPGPVRRWNYPVPLCLGNGWIYGHCLYFRQQTHCVASDGPSPLLIDSFIACVLCFKAVCLLLNQSQYLALTNKPAYYTFSFFFLV